MKIKIEFCEVLYSTKDGDHPFIFDKVCLPRKAKKESKKRSFRFMIQVKRCGGGLKRIKKY